MSSVNRRTVGDDDRLLAVLDEAKKGLHKLASSGVFVPEEVAVVIEKINKLETEKIAEARALGDGSEGWKEFWCEPVIYHIAKHAIKARQKVLEKEPAVPPKTRGVPVSGRATSSDAQDHFMSRGEPSVAAVSGGLKENVSGGRHIVGGEGSALKLSPPRSENDAETRYGRRLIEDALKRAEREMKRFLMVNLEGNEAELYVENEGSSVSLLGIINSPPNEPPMNFLRAIYLAEENEALGIVRSYGSEVKQEVRERMSAIFKKYSQLVMDFLNKSAQVWRLGKAALMKIEAVPNTFKAQILFTTLPLSHWKDQIVSIHEENLKQINLLIGGSKMRQGWDRLITRINIARHRAILEIENENARLTSQIKPRA